MGRWEAWFEPRRSSRFNVKGRFTTLLSKYTTYRRRWNPYGSWDPPQEIVNSTPRKRTNPTAVKHVPVPDASRPVRYQASRICRRGPRRARKTVAHFTAHFHVSPQASPKSSCCLPPLCSNTTPPPASRSRMFLKARLVTWWENMGEGGGVYPHPRRVFLYPEPFAQITLLSVCQGLRNATPRAHGHLFRGRIWPKTTGCWMHWARLVCLFPFLYLTAGNGGKCFYLNLHNVGDYSICRILRKCNKMLQFTTRV